MYAGVASTMSPSTVCSVTPVTGSVSTRSRKSTASLPVCPRRNPTSAVPALTTAFWGRLSSAHWVIEAHLFMKKACSAGVMPRNWNALSLFGAVVSSIQMLRASPFALTWVRSWVSASHRMIGLPWASFSTAPVVASSRFALTIPDQVLV